MAVYDADAFVEGIQEEQREEISNAEAVQTDDPNQDATVVQEPATPPPPEATAQEQIQEAAAEAQPQQADTNIEYHHETNLAPSCRLFSFAGSRSHLGQQHTHIKTRDDRWPSPYWFDFLAISIWCCGIKPLCLGKRQTLTNDF